MLVAELLPEPLVSCRGRTGELVVLLEEQDLRKELHLDDRVPANEDDDDGRGRRVIGRKRGSERKRVEHEREREVG